MRRKDKEINDMEEIENIIKKAQVCRLGLSDNNSPYIVPMNYGYKDNTLYIHSAKEGKKINIITRNPEVCFEIDIENVLIKDDMPCEWGMNFKSVIGMGTAEFIGDSEKKKEALNIIMSKYSEMDSYEFTDKALNSVSVIKVIINEMTGKKSGN